MKHFTRRGLLLGAAALPVAAVAQRLRWQPAGDDLQFVFMTDSHIQPGLRSQEWIRAMFQHINARTAKPALVVHGGDVLNGARGASPDEALAMRAQWDEEAKRSGLEIHYTLGNHDTVALQGAKAQRDHPMAGKRLFERHFGKGRSYNSFERGGVKFLLLDSVQTKPDFSYRGEIDDRQLQWIKDEVEAWGKERPIVVATHIPFFSIVPQYDAGMQSAVPDWQLVANAREIRALLSPYNVPVVLQGHTHVREDCFVDRTRFLTGGAVAGNWWNGKRFGTDAPGYMVVSVGKAGCSWEYVEYGWKAT